MLSRAIAWPDPALRLTHSWQAPLDVFIHSQVWLTFQAIWGWSDAAPVYRLLSPLAGILYLLAALGLSRSSHFSPGWLAFGLLASVGLLQLFFGYVENYSFAAAGVLIFLCFGLGIMIWSLPLWAASLTLAFTAALHPSTLVLIPSLLFLGWWTWRKGTLRLAAVAAQILVPMVVVVGGTVLLMTAGGHGLQALVSTDRPGGGDARWFVPLAETQTRWEHYTMWSLAHLRDFLNEQLLVAPVVLPGLILIGLWCASLKLIGRSDVRPTHVTGEKRGDLVTGFSGPNSAARHDTNRRRCWRGAPTTFLLIATAFYLLFIWTWNPDYGGQRDWDLFSLFALPATLLLAALLPAVLPERRYLRAAALPLLLVQAMHTAAWIYQNTLPWSWP
jgi:hypothetical protein